MFTLPNKSYHQRKKNRPLKYLATSFTFAFLLILLGCSDSGPGEEVERSAPLPAPAEESGWNSESWKTVIPKTCAHFSDGCNTCTRAPGAMEAACTRKACAAYEEPKCLDAEAVAASSTEPKTQLYICNDDKRIEVIYNLYIADDQRLKLNSDQIMFRDLQTRTAHLMTRAESASGERYQGGGLEFWGKGEEATVRQGDEELYVDCVIR